ncbi:unnamed protein product [Macrosiphum euphorbiae]|uniref:DUF4817 domain-containing protein n=1 Tax=Macrosiphum euphorbiae TaxID=13131 RepID=A0AAV0XCM0_9HEMI|nr:unnamed protein product [Macrosiphum euphorbiae]
MVRLSLQERVLVVKIFYCHSESYAETVRHLRHIMGRNEAPNESTVRRLMLKFKQTGSVQDVKTPTRQRSRRSRLNQAIVFDSVLTSPTTSLRRRSQQLAIPLSSLYRIMKIDLHLHPYKLQLTQELKAGDRGKRRQFVEWFHNMQVEDADFAMKIIFSDEAHFHMSGFVNKQNCRLWGTENPQQIEQRQMHPERVTVWCGFWSGGVIGPYFFQDEYENTVTVNGERYRDMITEFLWPAFNDFDITN